MMLQKYSRPRNRTAALLASGLLAVSSLSASFGVAGAQDGSLQTTAEQSPQSAGNSGSRENLIPGSVDLHKGDFYETLPEKIEGAPGEIIKSAPSNFALGIPLVDWAGSTATRVAYVSTNEDGSTAPVTGTVLTPTAPWKGTGPRPLVTIAPGTQGAGDACAPGKLLPYGVEYEGLPVAQALARGWNVALTDLPGLGTPAPHTYMNRIMQGNAMLDMARAAVNLNLPGIDANTPVATWGYSQGGGASASALELQPTYAPDVNLVAGYAGGVPADLAITAKTIDKSSLTGALGYTLNGLLYTHPELEPVIEEKLNDEGMRFLEQTKDECILQSRLRHTNKDSRTFTKTGESFGEILEEEPIKSVIDKQFIGNLPPTVPVYVGHGTNDDTILVEQSRRMARTWCEAGTPVNYQEHNLPQVARSLDHMAPMVSHLVPAMEWLEHVINGSSYATSNCGDIPEPLVPNPGAGAASGSSMGSVHGGIDTSVSGVPGSLGSVSGSSQPY